MQHNFPNRQRLESTHKRYETKRITPTYCSVRNFKIRCLRSSSRMFLDTYPMDMHAYKHISWILQTISSKRSHTSLGGGPLSSTHEVGQPAKPCVTATSSSTDSYARSFKWRCLRRSVYKYLSHAPDIQLRRKLQNPHDDAASLLASDTPNALQE